MKKVLLILSLCAAVLMTFFLACSNDSVDVNETQTDVVKSSELKGIASIADNSQEAKVVFYRNSEQELSMALSSDSVYLCNYEFSDLSITIKDDTSFLSGISGDDKVSGYLLNNGDLYLKITSAALNDTLFFTSAVDTIEHKN